MLTIFLVVLFVAAAVAGYLWWRFRPRTVISAIAVIGLLFAAGGIAAGSYPIALNLAQQGAIGGYQQFLNGNLVSANMETIDCSEDGPCAHYYSCNPYPVTVVDVVPDGKGGTTTQTRIEIHYHSCPYATQEFTFTLTDNFGNVYTLASHIFAAEPREWDPGSGIPGDVPRGVPAQWQEASDRLKAGIADPVTVPDTYDNYILAAESTLLEAYSPDIERLQEENLLPEHTNNLEDPIHGFYQADKVSFVGFTPDNADQWQDTLMQFNAALGMQYQGDMHVVAIKDSALPDGMDPQGYLNALKAYWLNDLGKNALAKNGIILVLGVSNNGREVVWSRSDTGMPVGNGAMLEALGNELEGTAFTPQDLFGETTAHLVQSRDGAEVDYTIGNGPVSQIVMVDYPFQRACMACDDKDEAGIDSFVYLSTTIPLGGWGILWTILIDLVIVAGLSAGALFYLFNEEIKSNQRSSKHDRFDPYDPYVYSRRY